MRLAVRVTAPLVIAAALSLAACGNKGDAGADIPPVPASHDPKGADLVQGAVVAATETNGGIRLNKIVHVDDFPLPLDYEFHMIAYEPKVQTWEEASHLWKDKKAKVFDSAAQVTKETDLKVVVPHFIVRRDAFMTRDYRVLYVEKVTPEESAAYEHAKNSRSTGQ